MAEDWTNSKTQGWVDGLTREGGYGSVHSSMADMFYGINHRGVGNPIPYNTDNYGLVFFTRPNLNLSYDNLAADRRLMPLAVGQKGTPDRPGNAYDKPTIQEAIRSFLDPWGTKQRQEGPGSKLVDNEQAFITILTNNLVSLNGWPDPVSMYFNSKDGPMKESWSIIDDVHHNYSTWEVQASFRNIAGDPITLLFNTWLIYATQVYVGNMMPYPQSLIENEIDYQSKIYRIVLDPSRKFVQKIATTIAFPTSSALGAAMNFTNDLPFNQDNATQIQIPFHCIGAEYQDPILIREFNDTVAIFNRAMESEATRKKYLKKVPDKMLNLFNNYGYPYIDPHTSKLDWFVKQEDFDYITAVQKTINPSFSNATLAV